ncbi:MAG: hypothetical protein EA393_07605 [Bacteroidetes bacterium]|nr:MAG: hypothetical protein EA393_07605 [Bacteroidota bacterium]
MDQLVILGLMVKEKEKHAARLQRIFTKYGCSIKTRLGLNELDIPEAGEAGLIILELMGDIEECGRLENELHSIDGITVRKMTF